MAPPGSGPDVEIDLGAHGVSHAPTLKSRETPTLAHRIVDLPRGRQTMALGSGRLHRPGAQRHDGPSCAAGRKNGSTPHGVLTDRSRERSEVRGSDSAGWRP